MPSRKTRKEKILATAPVNMEKIKPPKAKKDPAGPKRFTKKDLEQLDKEVSLGPVPPLSIVARNFTRSCAGGDRYENNCAHYLSNAFILSGYEDLFKNNRSINARCAPARRPIRAREMWAWFKKKQVRKSRTPVRNTGWWAVFQLNEKEYWGGHVAILDSDKWKWYGTGWFPDWDQHLYQW